MNIRRSLAAVIGVSSMVFGVATAVAQTPIIASDNIEVVGFFPDTAMISGEFARTGDFFYTSSTDTISVFDTSNPRQPTLVGRPYVNALFENESMTYGERIVGGELRRFVLAGVDLFAVPEDIEHTHIGFDKVLVVDVTDPMDINIIAEVELSTSAHTVQCIDQADCLYAYSAGNGGEFSIIDFTDLYAATPAATELKTVPSAAAGPNGVFSGGAGHYWDFDSAGIGWHTGSGGAVAYDVSDPTNPTPIEATDENGITGPYNDFILHNSLRPNGEDFQANTDPSVFDGNVLLVTEEDYLNDGDEIECELAGTFQTWHIPNMDAAAYQAGNPAGEPGKGTITPLDIVNAPHDFGGGLSTPVGAFCSAHWFDFHQDGYVIQGYYQQGVRLLDVRDARNIEQIGFYTPVATEAWDALWVPERDADGVLTGKKTNLVYTVDFASGIHVLEVTLDEGAQPTAPPTQPTGSTSPSPSTSASPSGSPTATTSASPSPSGSVAPTGGTTGTTGTTTGGLPATGPASLAVLGGLGAFALIAALRRRST